MQGPRVSVLVAESPLPVRRPPEHRRTGTVVRLRALAGGGLGAGRSVVLTRWPAELLPGHKKLSLSQLCTGSDQSIRTTEEPPPQESLLAAMKVELTARTSQTSKAGEETPPPSPSASAASPPAEDAPLLPDAGVRRRPACGRFSQRSGSFRREVSRAAAETFLLTRLTLILLRYLGYA